MKREASKNRETKETKVKAYLSLDGINQEVMNPVVTEIDTGIGFFNHMLELLAFHSGFVLNVEAKGDLDVCDHHTVEDIGIVLGSLFKETLGDKRGIARYGSFTMPMDETLCNVTLDFSGRPYLVYNCELKREQIGTFSLEMVPEFLRAFAFAAGLTLHVNVFYGSNDHHKVEAIFKALGRALKQAVAIESDQIPSSKGMLEE